MKKAIINTILVFLGSSTALILFWSFVLLSFDWVFSLEMGGYALLRLFVAIVVAVVTMVYFAFAFAYSEKR